MHKITFLLCLLIAFNSCAQSSKKDAAKATPKFHADIKIDDSWVNKIVKTEEEWKAQLTDKQFYILREQGTERPFSSELYNVKEAGVYVCAGCQNPLFGSDAKFDSGTGWPSYFKPWGPKSIDVHSDNSLGMSRDALSCKRCGGHLGHVFNDGPKPTGLRYCIDGDGMLFVPKS